MCVSRSSFLFLSGENNELFKAKSKYGTGKSNLERIRNSLKLQALCECSRLPDSNHSVNFLENGLFNEEVYKLKDF